jgi:ceramide glucosyltransferase
MAAGMGPGGAFWAGAHPLLSLLALLAAAGAALGILYTVLSAGLIGRFFARPKAVPVEFPAVTVLKPLHGGEWGLRRNLASFCAQDYPGPVQFLFGTHDARDAALATVEEIRREFPGAEIAVVSDSRLYGLNRKVSNTINMLPHARHDVLVLADSDVAVAPDYLRCLVGELQRPGVGLVTCAYRGEPDPGFWPRVSALAINCHFLPSVVTGVALGLAQPCFGQTIALRRETLRRIGGYEPFVNHLAEDYWIGDAVRKLGEKVAVPPFAIAHASVETSLRTLLAHELRWSRTIRRINPAGHLGSALVHPLPLALGALLLSGGAPWGWGLVAAAVLSRLALKLSADRALGQAPRDLWLLPLWDLLAFGIFVASFASKHVTWRGHAFTVDRRGILSPVAAP